MVSDYILEHSNISKALSAEGIVLLENCGVLPMAKSGAVALFGSGAFMTRASTGGGPGGPGGGPGGPNGPAPEPQGGPAPGGPDTPPPPLPTAKAATKLPGFHGNISDALTAAGYTLLTDRDGLVSNEKPDYVIYVLRRDSAEGSDRKDAPGGYDLTDSEKSELLTLAESYGKVILILNCCAVTDVYTPVRAINAQIPDGIGAVLYMGLGGEGAGDAVVSVLSGDITPSGKLADTWALQYADYPSAATFGERGHTNFTHTGDDEYYFEGIFNGYRYFDTFNIPVAYPFGFGLSYTTFDIITKSVCLSGGASTITLTAEVHNTGSRPGREVVQVYSSYHYVPGQSALETAYQTLAGYQKTRTLQPGEFERVEITIPIPAMSSYDEETDCFLLQQGEYLIRVGNSSRDTAVAAVLTLDEPVVTEKCTPGLFAIQAGAEKLHEHQLCYADIINPELPYKTWDPAGAVTISLPAEKLKALTVDSTSPYDSTSVITLVSNDKAADSHRWPSRSTPNRTGRREIYRPIDTVPDATLVDVADGKLTMEQFVAGLTTAELTDIVTGLSSEQTAHLFDPKNPVLAVCREGVSGYQSTKNLITSRFIPQVFQADGSESPGITLSNDEIWAGKTDSAVDANYSAVMLPSEAVMAQSWNPALVRSMGEAVGGEMRAVGLSIWLAPGANIHRNPLCGRNYQYYSEDPFLTGTMLTAEVAGVQSQGGVFCCVKHFAANNMETNRGEVNEIISERALREIYLPGWRMCAQSEYPNASFMSAYQQINGTYCGENYDLLTHLIRGEWKWDGFVMDDYTPWFFLCWRDLTVCPQVGNDLVMPGNTSDNVMAVPFVPMENPVTKMEFAGKTGPFQSDSYLMHIALRDGKLLLGDLQKSAMAILSVYMRAKVFADLRSAVKEQSIQPTRT